MHFDFDLADDFQSQRDYRADIKLVGQPVSVLAGTKDESFYAERLESIFREPGKNSSLHFSPTYARFCSPLILVRLALQSKLSRAWTRSARTNNNSAPRAAEGRSGATHA